MAERSGHKRIRGIAVRVAVFLLLGAIVNVAVAWGLAYWIPFAVRAVNESDWDSPDAVRWWHARVPLGVNGEPSVFEWAESLGYEGIEMHASTATQWLSAYVTRMRWGLPLLSMEDVVWSSYAETRRGEGFSIRNGMTIPLNGRAMPTVPIWPGFAINTLFYAAILWLLFGAPFTLRRWRRIRRGLCAKCAYPIGTSEVCTECGASINKTKIRGSRGLPSPAPPAGSASERTT